MHVIKKTMPNYMEDPERPISYSSLRISAEDLKIEIERVNEMAMQGQIQGLDIDCHKPEDLAFLSAVRGVRIISIASVNPIRFPEGMCVRGVESLFCSCRVFDTDFFPDLTYLEISGIDLTRSLLRSNSRLKRMYVIGFRSDGGLGGLAMMTSIVDLELVRSRSLVSLDGLHDLSSLRRLCLVQLSNVESIDGISNLSELTNLVLEGMKRISSYRAIAALNKLERLTITRSSAIDCLDEGQLKTLDVLAIWNTKYPRSLNAVVQRARSKWQGEGQFN